MPSHPHLKWIEINLQAIRANMKWVRNVLSSGTRLMAVVKADGYGHGAVPVSRLASEQRVSHLGVLTTEEALALRQAGIRSRIVVLSPPLPEEAPAVVQAQLEPTVDSLAQARALSRAARRAERCTSSRTVPGALYCARHRVLPIHLDLDYGLGRWGLAPKQLEDFLRKLSRLRHIYVAGLSTHIDYVPGKNAVEAEEKLRDFHRIVTRLKRTYPGIICHCANSAVLLDFPHWQMDMVRIGNLLYGINPTGKTASLADPWSVNARIIAIKEVGKGQSIGYASEYLAPRKMLVATLAVGYSDGLTMEPAERLIRLGSGLRYWGWLRGHQVPFVGRCGISHTLIDVSQVPRPRLGDVVSLPIRRTAASARLPRVYS